MDPGSGVRAGFEAEAAGDWGGVAGDRAGDVDTAGFGEEDRREGGCEGGGGEEGGDDGGGEHGEMEERGTRR